MKISTGSVELNDQFLADVLTTAVEGGITYWARADRVIRAGSDFRRDLDDLSVVEVVAVEDAETGELFGDVTLPVVARGFQALLSGDVQVGGEILGYLHAAVKEIRRGGEGAQFAAGEIDASAADCIIQAGLLGEIIYG